MMKAFPNIKLNFSNAPKTKAPVKLHSIVEPLKIKHNGPFVRNAMGQLVCVSFDVAYLSKNEGKTWRGVPLFHADGFGFEDSHSLLCTESGTIVLSFVNTADMYFNWRKKSNRPTQNTFVHHWIVRSEDGGYTWQAPILLQKGYAAASTTLIQLKTGELLVSAQNLDYAEGRHYSLSFRSLDDGLTWQASNKLDIGGRGHHGGCFEGTLVALPERLWYCIRTNHDWFWNAYSYDKGITWTELSPGQEASSSPAMLKRLASGRILMVYNGLYPQSTTEYQRRAGLFSEVAASWCREELSVIYSEDEGENWSQPIVVAQCKGAWLSYPHVFEIKPGKLWITTMQSELRIQLTENELIKAANLMKNIVSQK